MREEAILSKSRRPKELAAKPRGKRANRRSSEGEKASGIKSRDWYKGAFQSIGISKRKASAIRNEEFE
jgi:hypothetical protein